MNPLNYIISTNGLGIAIGIVGDKDLAQQDAILAENLYGSNHSEYMFASLLYMPSIRQFKKFIILKEYFRVWDQHFARNKVSGRARQSRVMQFTRRAIKQAKLVMESQVTYENFMSRMVVSSYNYTICNNTKQIEE